MRKILAAALASAMVLSMASISAFATSGEVLSEANVSGMIEYGSAFTKDDGTPIPRHTGTKNGSGDVMYVNEDLYFNLASIDVDAGILSNSGNNADDVTASIASIMKSQGGDIDDWSLKVKKNEGSKIIDKVTLVQKTVTGLGRTPMIKVTFKPEFTDTEYKVDLDITLTNKMKDDTAATVGSDTLEHGGKIFFNSRFYVSNRTDEGTDQDYKAGTAGIVVKPTKNEDNEIIWENENKDIAKLTFYADSDTAKYFPKLNTKWDNQAYFEYFNDQDSYLFEFISNPQISSTSRATLEIYNPYINEDDEEILDSENIIIYQIVDGLPVDVTSQFTYGENDDGDMTFSTKTRVLGSYIFCEKPYDESGDVVAPDTEAPADQAPVDTKKPANTGRY